MLDNFEFGIQFDERKYADVMRKVELLANRAQIEKAITRAAKKAANEAKKETAKLLASEYTLENPEIKKSLSTRKLAGSQMGAALDIASGVFALTKFKGVLPKAIMPPAKGPVNIKVKSSGSVAVFKRAYVAKMKSGHVGVFEREGEKSLPIEEHFGPSVPGMFGREKETVINMAVRDLAAKIFDQSVVTELENLMYG